MDNVWVLYRSVPYEGDTLLGIYSTLEAGLAAIRDEALRPPAYGGEIEQGADGNYSIGNDPCLRLDQWQVES